jgi:MFS family permease
VPDDPRSAPAAIPAADRTYAAYVVGVLFVAYVFSYVDRTILTLLVAPIRASLQISDTQVSLLHGLAFAVFYTVLGIPIARLADRAHRVRLISAGIVVWSLMTALCGLARSFGQLFLARVGVGVGEAALSPAAYSILGDYFRGPALARALSFYTAAIYVGAGLALMIGGALIARVEPMTLPGLGRLEPWQVVFLFVGLPGIGVALLMLTVREPPRTSGGSLAPRGYPLAEVLAHLRGRAAAYGLLIAAFSVAALLWNGAMAWIPTFFVRRHGWTVAEVGLRFGPVLLACGTAGVICGGLIGGWLAGRGHVDANPRVGLVSAALILPAGLAAPLLGDAWASLGAFALFCFAGSMPYGAAGAALTEITPNQMRAQVIAIYFFVQNLAGIGLGPTVVALLTDRLFGDDRAVGQSLAVVTVIAAPLTLLLVALALKPYRRCLAAARA